jgi:propanol-preferring alcohol dehydrogenase
MKLPLVGGHEGAGVVVAKGELVEDIEIGDHAGVKVYTSPRLIFQIIWKAAYLTSISLKWINGTCLQCSFCQQADEPLCPKARMSGYTVDGTFQQYCIAKAAHVARIPKNVPLDAVSPILCAGITVYKGLKESAARPGQTVAIVGAGGGLGSLACQYAKAMGLEIIAIDGGSEKAEMTKKLGAKHFIDFQTSKDLVEDVKAATDDGLGPHAVLLVAVSEKPFQQAAEVL